MLGDRDYMRPQRGSGVGGGGGFLGTLTGKLIFANILVYIMQNLSPGLSSQLGLSAWALKEWHLHRLVTYMFAHSDTSILHIAFNMWALYLFGQHVERMLGATRFAIVYFVSGFLGAGLWLAANWQAPGLLIGASGAVMGIVAAAATLFPDMRVMLLFPPIPMSLRTMAILIVAFESYMEISHAGKMGIAHLAHLGGFFCGLGYTLWLKNAQNPARRKPKRSRSHPAAPGLRKLPPADDFDARVDEILDKIGRQGMSSLTREEREILDRARDKLK